jgi:hypothetical protein
MTAMRELAAIRSRNSAVWASTLDAPAACGKGSVGSLTRTVGAAENLGSVSPKLRGVAGCVAMAVYPFMVADA